VTTVDQNLRHTLYGRKLFSIVFPPELDRPLSDLFSQSKDQLIAAEADIDWCQFTKNENLVLAGLRFLLIYIVGKEFDVDLVRFCIMNSPGRFLNRLRLKRGRN
jgi:hypothetical protein